MLRTNAVISTLFPYTTLFRSFQCRVIARHRVQRQSVVMAAAVGGPDSRGTDARTLPSQGVTARPLHRSNRRPIAKLTGHYSGALVAQLRTCRRAGRIQEIVVADFNQTGRAE